jgi:uncharacterized membrane protein
MEVWRKYKTLVFIVIFFGILYSLISLINHYFFRTYALDLGAYTNALYDYLHLQWNDSTVFKEVGENLLADHFDLYLIFFSPLSLIFKTYTLLIVQIIFLLFGGAGVYFYFKTSENTSIATFATIYIYTFFGVFAAVSSDYHSNVVAAALIPWFFYLIRKKQLIGSSLLLLLILVSKENISLWSVFVCIGMAFEYRKNFYLRNYLLLAAVFSGIYFISMISVVMPAFSNKGYYPHFHYSFLGNNFSEAALHLIFHPLQSLKILFVNHNEHPHGDFVKAELHLLLIFSGLPLLVTKPQYLLMLLPIYFQKLFHDDYAMWGIGGQYTIEFSPIMAIGIFTAIADLKKIQLIKTASIIVLLSSIGATVRTMDNTIYFTNKPAIRFYKSSHYQRNYNVKKVHELLSKIPENAILSVQSPFLPHLSLRDNIYQFPIIKNAEYIIYSEMENSYPITNTEFIAIVTKLRQAKEWEVLYNEDVIILKRISF